MKIALIIILALAIFMFFSTRNSKSKEEWAEKQKVSKEKFNELVKNIKIRKLNTGFYIKKLRL